MSSLNRALYILSIASLIIFAVLFIIALWGRFENETMIKSVGSTFVLFAASFLWLVINLHVERTKESKKEKEG